MHKQLPKALYCAADVRRLDAAAIERFAVPGYTLMTRAGAAAFSALREHWPLARTIAVVCGAGNNAGDGFVIARLAQIAGLRVVVHAVAGSDGLRGDAASAWRDMVAAGVAAPLPLAAALAAADVVVDAIFGTGLDRPVAGPWEAAIAAVNACGKPVLAVDIPSGLHADHGRVMGVAVRAQLTVTFIGLKQGLLRGAGREVSGKLVFDDLKVPAAVYETVASAARRLSCDDLAGLLPVRSRAAHKGHFGHVLVVGGARGMMGAALLAGAAAVRSGAGLVSVATHREHAVAVTAARPELMCYGVEDRQQLEALLQRASVVAIGPGLGQGRWGQMLWSHALESTLPLVVDADALNLLAAEPLRRDNWVLTPHPGEAGRLLQMSAQEVEQDPFAAVRCLQQRYGGVVVLKGAGSLVAEDTAPLTLIDAGNPGMACGGMGDVLTGVIGALLAQGLPLGDAARAGACMHAGAADAVAAAEGERGLAASDVVAMLRHFANPRHTHGH